MAVAAPTRFGAQATDVEPDEQRVSDTQKLLFAGILLFAILYPVIDEALGIGRITAMGAMLVYVILALGLNIVVGYAGLLDLGYAAFFAIGAYTIGFLTSPSSVFVQEGWVPDVFTGRYGFWLAITASWITAAIFGVLLGAPTLRLRGDYLAIVTLGFGEIVPNFFLNAEGISEGVRGLNPIGKPTLPFTIFDRRINFGPSDESNWYWLVLGVALLSFFMIGRFYNSRLGRTWTAIREDEIAASSMGVNLVTTKLWAFALGASFAGFAGSVYASFFQYVHPSNFQFSVSVTVLAMIILGGLGNRYGAVVGALLIGFFDRILAEELNRPMHWIGDVTSVDWLYQHDVKQDRFLVFGLALVIMMLTRPEGIIPNKRRQAELRPETEDEFSHEQQQLYDILEHQSPTAAERL
jgi:branched-chain amino acid transport system permease protein